MTREAKEENDAREGRKASPRLRTSEEDTDEGDTEVGEKEVRIEQILLRSESSSLTSRGSVGAVGRSMLDDRLNPASEGVAEGGGGS